MLITAKSGVGFCVEAGFDCVGVETGCVREMFCGTISVEVDFFLVGVVVACFVADKCVVEVASDVAVLVASVNKARCVWVYALVGD